MDIAKLRSMRGKSDFAKIASALEQQKNGSSNKDDRFWKLEVDKAGNGKATIRFLPTCEGDELPWVRMYTHAFKGPTGKWYIENCLSTIGQDDYVNMENAKLWQTGLESDKEIARARKRKVGFIANILVIDDPKNPENNGKVFLWKFGKKIFDKIMDKARPTFEDEDPVNVFDFWEGANFKLVQRKVEGYPNYDQSQFSDPSELFGGDEEKILAVAKQQTPLREFLAPENFKPFEELKRRYEEVVSEGSGSMPTAQRMAEEPVAAPREEAAAPAKEQKAAAPAASDAGEEEDDVLKYFQNL
jgi:hypothetical protein